VSFLNTFNAIIDCFSLPRVASAAESRSFLSRGDVVLARVVFVDHGSRNVRMSMRPHVLELRAPENLPALG